MQIEKVEKLNPGDVIDYNVLVDKINEIIDNINN